MMEKSFCLRPRSWLERLTAGLRDYEQPGEVRVFKARADGTAGKLLRIEAPPPERVVGYNNRRRELLQGILDAKGK